MWLIWFMVVCALFMAVVSPVIGLGLLLTTRIGLALAMGQSLDPWVFMLIILVYVGGVIVIFVYLTGLISAVKIVNTSPRAMLAGALAGAMLAPLGPSGLEGGKLGLWLGQRIDRAISPLIVYRILYLLLSLIVVFNISSKLEGPLKQ